MERYSLMQPGDQINIRVYSSSSVNDLKLQIYQKYCSPGKETPIHVLEGFTLLKGSIVGNCEDCFSFNIGLEFN